MKKIKFTGVVNGVEYNNVSAYNEAVTKAMENGVVEAYTKTETVDNEPEAAQPSNENINNKCKFIGVVNGVEYDNVQDYNDALTKAIHSGNVNAYTKTENCCNCCENECGCNDECENKELPNINYLPGFFENGEEVTSEYVDNNTNGFCDGDWVNHYHNLQVELGDNLREIREALNKFNSEDRKEYLKDIDEVLNKINQDEEANNEALNRLHASLADLRNSISVCKRGVNIINLYKDFYKVLRDEVVSQESIENVNDVRTSVVEVTPQKEVSVDEMTLEQEVENTVKRFLNKLFG